MAPQVTLPRNHAPKAAESYYARRPKRTRLTSPTDMASSSLSESTHLSSSAPQDSTDASSAETDSDSSELSESSEEPSDDDSSEADRDGSESELEEAEDGDGVVNVRANRGKKPKMTVGKGEMGPELKSWLREFLPKLKAANEELEAEREAGTLETKQIEAEGDEGHYIEMDLGLGVFEERDPDANSDSSDDSNDTDSESTGKAKERDVLGKLMGRKHTGEVGVEEVDEAPST